MNTSSPPTPATSQRQSGSAQGTAILALVMPLALVLWLPVMFALGYWVADVTDTYPSPGSDLTLWQVGPVGWVTAVVFAVLAALPCLLGLVLAQGARRRGAGVIAAIALAVNGVLAVALIGWTLIG